MKQPVPLFKSEFSCFDSITYSLLIVHPSRHAKVLQSGLIAIAEKIEGVKADHEKLEKENLALQDYIGGLTRSMSNTAMSSFKSKK